MSFILALQPHQRPGTAYAFENEQEMIDAWVNGLFRQWNADNAHEIEGEATLNDAISDIQHDLHSITFIETRQECEEWLSGKRKTHNFPFRDVLTAAKHLGWIEE